MAQENGKNDGHLKGTTYLRCLLQDQPPYDVLLHCTVNTRHIEIALFKIRIASFEVS